MERLKETCRCGSSTEIESEDRDYMRHVINIWRKWHRCEGDPPREIEIIDWEKKKERKPKPIIDAAAD